MRRPILFRTKLCHSHYGFVGPPLDLYRSLLTS